FYWYFEAEHPSSQEPPLLIWLQGGPGATSMIGLFQELGPFKITQRGLERRKYSWTDTYDVVFIDSPVGTGLHESSYTQPPSLHARDVMCKDQDCVSRDLMAFLGQFYSLYPHLRKRDLYIAGESYGGKYVPSFATAILDENDQREKDQQSLIPLKGIAIGNGLTDPITQVLTHPAQALALGLVDEKQAKVLEGYAIRSAELAQQEKWLTSLEARLTMFDLFANFTGKVNFYDVRKANQPNDWRPMRAWLSRRDVQRALNIPGFGSFLKTPLVALVLLGDIMKPTSFLFPRLLSRMHVLLYQGNYDFRDGVMGNSPWISSLSWPGRQGFANSPRQVWKIGKRVAGYVREYGHLRRVIVLGAGHLVPMDQGEAAQVMITSWMDRVQGKRGRTLS
ncbi:Alpha/Beta hydrolase protein, partial [Piptocephalis cylindrospora]